jgi:parallel beta-helix repeat protein
MAYVYPIGIPPAWIDPNIDRPARPSPWTSEVAGYYYLDWTAGTDSGRTYGHPGAPRKTIPNPIPAGSYVEINSTYTGSGDPITVNGAGDAGAWAANTSGPAWIGGLDASNRASFGRRVLARGTYLYFDHFDNLASAGDKFQVSSSTSGTGIDADFILIRNFELDGDGLSPSSTAMPIVGNTDNSISNVIVYNGQIHNFGSDTPGVDDTDYVGVFPGDYSSNVWVLDNTIHDMAGGGVVVSSNTTDTPRVSNVFVGRNLIYNTWAVGLAVKTSENVVFSQNTIHSVNWTDWSDGKGIGGQYSCQSTWILFNTIYNCDFGIRFGSTNVTPSEITWIIGNVIYDIQEDPLGTYAGGAFGSAAISLRGTDYRYVLNNTIHDCKGGIYVTSGNDGSIIENNILSEITDFEVWVDLGSTAAIVRNNLLYNSGGGEIVRYSNTERSVTDFNTAFSGSANATGDPLFNDAAGGDFTIESGSPAVGMALAAASLTSNAYTTYFTEFGESIDYDRAGNVRPAGAEWDAGAYEYSAGGGGGGLTITTDTVNVTNFVVGA